MKKFLIVTSLALSTAFLLDFNVPQLVATCGFATSTANNIVNIINAYGTASMAISLVLAITGGGAAVSALVSTVYSFIKKKGSGAAVTW